MDANEDSKRNQKNVRKNSRVFSEIVSGRGEIVKDGDGHSIDKEGGDL